MKKSLCLVLLLAFAAAGIAEAGQFRIAPPRDQRKRQPPPHYRESRLTIVNEDDRGYAIDVDYRRNRLELDPRSRGDIYVPANSRITLTFDDDDNWRIIGDNDSLEIEIRSGGVTTLRLETRMNRHQIGLFGTVNDGRRTRSVQLFRYADRPGRGRPNDNRHPAPPQAQPHQPTPPRQPNHPQQPGPQQPGRPQAGPQQPGHSQPNAHQPTPPRGPSAGSAIGGLLDRLLDDDRPPPRR